MTLLPSLNNVGTVAFRARVTRPGSFNLFVGDGGTPDKLYDGVGWLSTNDQGVVAFRGTENGTNGIFRGNGGPLTTIALQTPGGGLNTPSINNQGKVVFSSGGSILLGEGGTLTTIADTSGEFSTVFDPRINNADQIVFTAGLDIGGVGLYIWEGGTVNEVAKTGSQFTVDSGNQRLTMLEPWLFLQT